LIKTATHEGKSLLDHIYVNHKHNYPISGHFPFAGSDHDLTFVIRKVNKLKFPTKTINYRKYKECNWDEIGKTLNQYEFKSENMSNTDQIFWDYNNFIMSTLDKCMPE